MRTAKSNRRESTKHRRQRPAQRGGGIKPKLAKATKGALWTLIGKTIAWFMFKFVEHRLEQSDMAP